MIHQRRQMLILKSHKGEITLKDRIMVNITMKVYNTRISHLSGKEWVKLVKGTAHSKLFGGREYSKSTSMAGMEDIKEMQDKAGRKEWCLQYAWLFGYPNCLFFK